MAAGWARALNRVFGRPSSAARVNSVICPGQFVGDDAADLAVVAAQAGVVAG
jgi:hypothetical protein